MEKWSKRKQKDSFQKKTQRLKKCLSKMVHNAWSASNSYSRIGKTARSSAMVTIWKKKKLIASRSLKWRRHMYIRATRKMIQRLFSDTMAKWQHKEREGGWWEEENCGRTRASARFAVHTPFSRNLSKVWEKHWLNFFLRLKKELSGDYKSTSKDFLEIDCFNTSRVKPLFDTF